MRLSSALTAHPGGIHLHLACSMLFVTDANSVLLDQHALAVVLQARVHARWNTPTVTQVRGTGQSGGGTPGNEILDIFGNFYGPKRSGPGPAGGIIVRYGSGTNLDSGDPTKVYTALSCRVVTANTWIRCVTAPGYGSGHMLTVTIGDKASGNQRTSAKFAANIRYAAPIVALYSGPGAVDGSTYGNQSLVVTGANFGPANPPTPISVAEYGDGNYQLEAKDCHVTVPHTEISCTTSPGAGAQGK